MAEPNRTPGGDDGLPPEDAGTRPTSAARPAPPQDASHGPAADEIPPGTAGERAQTGVEATGSAARAAQPSTAPPAAPADQPVLQPADADQPPAPKQAGNRLVGTAWVLLAAGLFQLLYFAALALIVLLLGGAAAIGDQLALIARTPFAWLPVLFFFLLFELTVLLFNRAGRFAYVVASLVVGFLVYLLSVLLISILVRGGIGDTSTLAQAFESPEFLLTGLVAREVMLWTGFAIGARGRRVRTRNTRAKQAYRQELAERVDSTA